MYAKDIYKESPRSVWGVIFNSYFYKDEYMLHWGNTISKSCERSDLCFEPDIRILVMSPDEDIADGATAEVAKKGFAK